MYNHIDKLASAVYNNVSSGLSGFHTNHSLNLDLIKDTIIDERLSILKQYIAKGLINPKDLYHSINCINIDCDTPIEQCRCGGTTDCDTIVPHFEIPQLVNDFGDNTILYIGSVDKEVPFIWYTNPTSFRNHKYKKRGKNKPYVWIDTTPNKNGMYDCFVFNAPLLNQISITAVFKDLRQLEQYSCCTEDTNRSFIDADVVERVTKKLLMYYRQFYMQPMPNNQSYTPA